MYRHNLKQLEFEDFNLPFDGKLRSDNRWVKMAKFIPWSDIEPFYVKSLSRSQKGPPAMSVRVALPQKKGKLLIDATCTHADITFPTDLKMLNTAREKFPRNHRRTAPAA